MPVEIDIEQQLRMACAEGNLSRVEELLQLNPDLSATDDEGFTILEDVIFANEKKIAQKLLESGADIDPAMQWQEVLRKEGLEDIADYLLKVWRTGRTKSADESMQIRQQARKLCPIDNHDIEIVKKWIGTIETPFPMSVREIKIDPVPQPRKNQKVLSQIFHDAFDNAESRQHGFLKWFALMRFLGDVIPQQRKSYYQDFWHYEAEIVIPPPTGEKRSTKGQILSKDYIGTAYGRTIRADVVANGFSIECGVTRAENLIEPIVCKAVKKTIWIPFVGVDQNEDWSNFESKIPAYQISRARKKK